MCEEASSGQILDNEMPAGRPESSQTGLRYSSAAARGFSEEDHIRDTGLGGRQLHEACLDCDSGYCYCSTAYPAQRSILESHQPLRLL